MLGLIHRTAVGKGPQHFRRFFYAKQERTVAYWTKNAKKKHSRQLQEDQGPHCPELLRRSALGLVKVYNMHPKDLVVTDCVKDVQKELQELVKKRAASGCENWKETFSPRVLWWQHPLR